MSVRVSATVVEPKPHGRHGRGLGARRVTGLEAARSDEAQWILVTPTVAARARDDVEDPAAGRGASRVPRRPVGPAQEPRVITTSEVAVALGVEGLREILTPGGCRQESGADGAEGLSRCGARGRDPAGDGGEGQRWRGLGYDIARSTAA